MSEAERELMPLAQALHILSEAHTRDDDLVGYTVEVGVRYGRWDHGDYIKAWASVRHAIGKAAFPAHKPT